MSVRRLIFYSAKDLIFKGEILLRKKKSRKIYSAYQEAPTE